MAGLRFRSPAILSWPNDPRGRLLAYIEANDYRIGDTYRERRAHIVECGKYDLLIRISQHLAEQRLSAFE